MDVAVSGPLGWLLIGSGTSSEAFGSYTLGNIAHFEDECPLRTPEGDRGAREEVLAGAHLQGGCAVVGITGVGGTLGGGADNIPIV